MGWAINVWFLLRSHNMLLSSNRWTMVGCDTWPQLWWKAQVLPGLACERVKHNSTLGRCCFLTLTRKFLPRFLSAKVGNDSLETLFTFPPPTISDTLSSWKAGFKPCNSHSKSAKQKDREGGREKAKYAESLGQRKDKRTSFYLHCFATLEIPANGLENSVIWTISFVIFSVPVWFNWAHGH